MRKLWKSTWRHRRDLRNMLKYGLHAPKSCQLMYCRPGDIARHSTYVRVALPDHCATVPAQYAQHSDILQKKMVSMVAGGDWDQHHMPIAQALPYKLTLEKLESGKSWEEVGEYARMEEIIRIRGSNDQCQTRDDLDRRYAQMDAMAAQIRKERRLKTRKELGDVTFRELGGINLAIDREGGLIKLDGGTHRLAMAAYFDLPALPVCLRIVHEDCVHTKTFRALMARSDALAAEIRDQKV